VLDKERGRSYKGEKGREEQDIEYRGGKG